MKPIFFTALLGAALATAANAADPDELPPEQVNPASSPVRVK